ncbi:hypothetical protein GCM10023085_22620 [Actinomadura viridis]
MPPKGAGRPSPAPFLPGIIVNKHLVGRLIGRRSPGPRRAAGRTGQRAPGRAGAVRPAVMKATTVRVSGNVAGAAGAGAGERP